MITNGREAYSLSPGKSLQPNNSLIPFLPSPDVSIIPNSKFRMKKVTKACRLKKRFTEEAEIYSISPELINSRHQFSRIFAETTLLNNARQIKYVASLNQRTSSQIEWKPLNSTLIGKLTQSSCTGKFDNSLLSAEVGRWAFDTKQKNILRVKFDVMNDLETVVRTLELKTTPEVYSFYSNSLNDSATGTNVYPCSLSSEVLHFHSYTELFQDREQSSFNRCSTLKRLSVALDSSSEARDFVYQDTSSILYGQEDAVISFQSQQLTELPPKCSSSRCVRSFFLPHSGFLLSKKLSASGKSKVRVTLLLQVDLGQISFKERFVGSDSLLISLGALFIRSLLQKLSRGSLADVTTPLMSKKQSIDVSSKNVKRSASRFLSISGVFSKRKRRKLKSQKSSLKLTSEDDRVENNESIDSIAGNLATSMNNLNVRSNSKTTINISSPVEKIEMNLMELRPMSPVVLEVPMSLRFEPYKTSGLQKDTEIPTAMHDSSDSVQMREEFSTVGPELTVDTYDLMDGLSSEKQMSEESSDEKQPTTIESLQSIQSSIVQETFAEADEVLAERMYMNC